MEEIMVELIKKATDNLSRERLVEVIQKSRENRESQGRIIDALMERLRIEEIELSNDGDFKILGDDSKMYRFLGFLKDNPIIQDVVNELSEDFESERLKLTNLSIRYERPSAKYEIKKDNSGNLFKEEIPKYQPETKTQKILKHKKIVRDPKVRSAWAMLDDED